MNCLDNIKLYTVIIQKNSKLKQKVKDVRILQT